MSEDAPAPGDWLRQQMERRQLTTHDVARATGLRDQAVYYWLTGRTAPKDEAAGKLAELLGVPEVEVRRRFGLWIPSEQDGHEPAINRSELEQIRADIIDILQRIERLQS